MLGLKDYTVTIPAGQSGGPFGVRASKLYVKSQTGSIKYTFLQNDIGSKGGEFTTSLLQGASVSFPEDFDVIMLKNEQAVDVTVVFSAGDAQYNRTAGGSYVGAAENCYYASWVVNGASPPAIPWLLFAKNPQRRRAVFQLDLQISTTVNWITIGPASPAPNVDAPNQTVDDRAMFLESLSGDAPAIKLEFFTQAALYLWVYDPSDGTEGFWIRGFEEVYEP